ncbi:L-2-hydroxyglutarate oxidase [Lacihabitans sp. CS3-21]|jgi:L-2-hydroxyglutarate oxidase|uniref:L-2-hydroxyglutarate oxidase n=1 Tax=Lacihabitans sp. CS3-21 TaxID=2487332 RepID=UPI0020CE1D86|nr:L-2-hydroxyglutarate oxidase [Lacihabitans sp. CS3-21]MCP9748653.1 L-2-hydroxyglutarate oxidase [Lacihabitans sp. CS3-21]
MHYDVVVIGGGIVGLATALNLKKAKPSLRLLLLEKENSLAAHQTGHNSGVIHSGLYYKPGSLKAKNCIEGYHMLIDFCNENNIKYELCGKIVVATSEDQLASLETLYERGIQNGLKGLEKLNKEQMQAIEPHVAGIAGIKVPQTGIINYTAVSEKYAENIKNMGGEIRLGEKVSSISEINGVSTVVTTKGSYNTTLVINCAGLYSDKVAQFTEKEQVKVRIIPFRGEYYEIKPEKQYLVKHLIYPVPDPNFPFLGVHFTRMVDGGVEAGPNAVLAFRREGYKKLSVDFSEFGETLAWPGFRKVAAKYWKTGLGEYYRSFSKSAFTKALQALIPEIQKEDLVPGGAGVRAQACDYDGGLLDDFAIIENKQAINVLNAPSPAATSSLSIGKTVAEMALKRLN